MRLFAVFLVLAAAASALADSCETEAPPGTTCKAAGDDCVCSLTHEATTDSGAVPDVALLTSAHGLKTLRGAAKLPDAARVVHRWRPAVCQRAKLAKACPLGITTFADGHAAVSVLGVKLPQPLGNAVARAVRRALPKAVADDLAPTAVTLPKSPEECAARDAQVNKENGGHCSWITLSGGYCNCLFGSNNLPNTLPNNPPSRPVLGSGGIIINID